MIRTPTRRYGGHPTIDPNHAWYQTAEGCADVRLAWQRTGYGEKAFLVCPICGARREKLYISNWVVGCRDHITNGGLYKGIQNTTKGGADRIAYTMSKIADRHLIDYKIGNDPIDYILKDERPRYMPKIKFSDVMARLDLLERLRVTAIFKAFPLYGKRTAAHLEDNIPLISYIERSSMDELSYLKMYRDDMSLAQFVYRQDWGFPEME